MTLGPRIWRFHRFPQETGYAQASQSGGFRGSRLGFDASGRFVSLVLEWEPGATAVGDFTIAFPRGVVVTERVAVELSEQFGGISFGPVGFTEDLKLTRTKKTRVPRIKLPYVGPSLSYIYPEAEVRPNLSHSTFEIDQENQKDGALGNLIGVERIEWVERRPTLVERIPGKGLFIDNRDFGSADIFRVLDFPNWIFCTDGVRSYVLEKGYTNVGFLEMGNVL